MAKKAKLDLLEEKIVEETKVETAVPDEKDVPQGIRPSWFTRGRILAIIFSTCILICSTVVSVWMYSRGKAVKTVQVTLPKQIAAIPTVPAVTKEETAAFNGFVICLKDAQGNYRTLICDVALALINYGEDIKKFEQRIDVRNVIHTAARNKGGILSASRDDMNRFRGEINDKLNSLLGGNRVKAVYFTAFVIL